MRSEPGRSAAALLLAAALGTAGCTTPTAPKPVPTDARARAHATLEAYRAAFEARDLARLEAVWSLTPAQRGEVQRLFGRDEPLRLRIDWVAFTDGPQLAIADFDQTLRRGDGPSVTIPLTAALVPADETGWKIAFLAEREAATDVAAGDTAAPDGTAPESAPLTALPWSGTARRSVAHLRAELVRRDSGEWVIVRLVPASAEAHPAGTPGSALPRDATGAAIRSVLDEYARAFEERDISRLGRVWLMNPYEIAQVDALFGWSRAVDVAIADPAARIEGDRAWLDFDQAFHVTRGPRVARLARRAFVRALAAHDAQGAWDLERLEHP